MICRRLSLLVFLVVASLLVAERKSSADIILEYDVADSELGNLAPNVNSNVIGDDMAAGAGLSVKTSGNTWNWKDWNPSNSSFSDAVAADDVWTWGFDVKTVVEIDLTTLDIRLRRSGQGPRQFEIQASVNGGAGVSLITHDFGDSTAKTDFFGIDLSALGTLKNGDSVVFTLAAFESSTANGAFDLESFVGQSHGLRISGDVQSVPEPGPFGALLAIGYFAWTRRKRSES